MVDSVSFSAGFQEAWAEAGWKKQYHCNDNKQTIYSESTIAREPATIIVFGRPLGVEGSGKALQWKKRKGSRYVLTA